MMVDRVAFIESARSWLDTPWKHNQSKKGLGVDCVRFLEAVARDNQIELQPMPKFYKRNIVDDSIIEYLSSHFHEVDLDSAKMGDILVFRIGETPHHVGLLSGLQPLKCIHASLERGKVVEEVLPPRILSRLIKVYGLCHG